MDDHLAGDVKGMVCERCMTPIPPKSPRCPSCGQPVPNPHLFLWAVVVFALLAVGLTVWFTAGR
jgi:predicted amidophosphoribosyltransferase